MIRRCQERYSFCHVPFVFGVFIGAWHCLKMHCPGRQGGIGQHPEQAGCGTVELVCLSFKILRVVIPWSTLYTTECNGKFDRQSPAAQAAGGKSGLHRAGCWITSSQRELKDSATETDRRWPAACGSSPAFNEAGAQARVEPWCKRPRGAMVT